MFLCFYKPICMLDTLEEIKRNLQKEIKGISTLKGAEQLKIKYLGRNGGINDLMKLIPTLPVEKTRRIWAKNQRP